MRKVCILAAEVELSRPVSSVVAYPKSRWITALVAAFALGAVFAAPTLVFAQEAIVASVNPNGAIDPNPVAPEQSIDLTSDINPPLPVASTDQAVESVPATVVDSGVPRRFHYQLHLSIRGVYDDNINLLETNRISDFYISIEPGVTLGFGDTVGRTENYLRLDYLPAIFLFTDHSENNSLNHVFRLEGQYRVNRLTLTLSQMVQLMDGVDVQGVDSQGGLNQQVNLDVAGRTEYDIFTTHFNAAYYVSGKTFLSGGVDFTATEYTSLISSHVIQGNFYLNYDYSPKLTVGLGGVAGYDEVDEPNPDQNYEQVNLRASYQATGKLTFTATGGVEFRHFDGDLEDTHVSPVFDLGANYTPFDGTRISLTATNRILNSAVLAAQNYMVTNITLGIQQRLLQRIFISFNGGFETSDYFSTSGSTGPSREDDYFFVEPSVAVSVTRYWTIGAYYLHRENSSSFDNFSFHDNQVGIRSTFEF
jgi:hypothetical protein